MTRSGDGSFTLYSQAYGEHYHSVREGALIESLEKHVRPALRFSGALKKPVIRVLDICFGLGYNTLCTLYELNRLGYQGRVEIEGPEKDEALLERLYGLPYPQPLLPFLDVISAVSRGQNYETGRVSVRVFRGDAVEFVKTSAGPFDLIYQDPFSSKKNPELWDAHFFGELYRLLSEDGVLTTYSQSKGVRRIMQAAGFVLHEHPFDPASTLRPGTLGVKKPIKELACLQV
ncbi:MAG: tRNA (5-methylaminomethyl-2-thiouridine)(34)-methyltransferase MnmD [Campylobacterales bacterium]